MSEVRSQDAAAPVRLRQAREAAGLHIAALAAALKVPVRKLEALEAGRYHELPDLTFARALASSACRHLRIDPAHVLEEIPHPDEPHLSQFPKAISAPFRTPPSESAAGSSGGGMKRAVWLALLLMFGAAVVFFMPDVAFWSKRSSADSVADPQPAGGLVVDPVNTPPSMPPGTPAAGEAVDSTTISIPDESSAVAVSTAQGQEVSAPQNPGAPVSAASGLLVLRAKGDSWIEVVNGNGSVVVQRMLRTGDVLDFSSAPPYRVVLGKADQVEVLVRGQPMDVSTQTRNSVARFEVK